MSDRTGAFAPVLPVPRCPHTVVVIVSDGARVDLEPGQEVVWAILTRCALPDGGVVYIERGSRAGFPARVYALLGTTTAPLNADRNRDRHRNGDRNGDSDG